MSGTNITTLSIQYFQIWHLIQKKKQKKYLQALVSKMHKTARKRKIISTCRLDILHLCGTVPVQTVMTELGLQCQQQGVNCYNNLNSYRESISKHLCSFC